MRFSRSRILCVLYHNSKICVVHYVHNTHALRVRSAFEKSDDTVNIQVLTLIKIIKIIKVRSVTLR
jgi:hypothetical protein